LPRRYPAGIGVGAAGGRLASCPIAARDGREGSEIDVRAGEIHPGLDRAADAAVAGLGPGGDRQGDAHVVGELHLPGPVAFQRIEPIQHPRLGPGTKPQQVADDPATHRRGTVG